MLPKKVRDIISDLIENKSDIRALSKAIHSLTSFELDDNTRSALNYLNRIYSENKYLPECYVIFLHENQYLSYQCHISVTNKHMENSWDN